MYVLLQTCRPYCALNLASGWLKFEFFIFKAYRWHYCVGCKLSVLWHLSVTWRQRSSEPHLHIWIYLHLILQRTAYALCVTVRQRLQRIQNSVIRLVCSEPTFSHAAALLHSLHWMLFQSTSQRLITLWCGLEQRAVDDAIDQWQRRLLVCVDGEGGHFEHNPGL